jgi:hypothetical protein
MLIFTSPGAVIAGVVIIAAVIAIFAFMIRKELK